MKLGLGNQLMVSPVNSVPLGERPTLGVSFDRSRYTNPLGYANQTAVGSSNFKLQSYAGPNVKFSRSSMATFRGSDGLIQYAPENLFSQSEDFSTSWSRNGYLAFGSGSIVNAATAPNGTQTADFIVPTASDSYKQLYQIISVTGRVSFSCYAKAGLYSRILLEAGGVGYASFNIGTGSIVTTSNGTSSIENVGNGWYRCVYTFAATGSAVCIVQVPRPSDGALAAWSGDGTSGIYIWGAQLERHSTARPYISTTALPAVYGPRFEYDTNGNPLGLLMEEQSQNLLQRSEEFSNGYWSNTNSSEIANSAASPNGLNSAFLLYPTSSGGGPCQIYSSAVSVVSGSSYVYSIFVKKQSFDWFWINAYNGSNQYTYFNISSGTIGTTPAGVVPEINDCGNGWYRLSCKIVSASTSFTAAFGVCNANGSLAITANGTNGTYIWGAQLEPKPFATSYIPTVGGTVVRSADLCSVDGADFSLTTDGGWFNPYNGTVVCKGDRFGLHTDIGDSIFDFTDTISSAASLLHFTDSPSGLESVFLTFEDYTTQYPVTLAYFDPNDPAVRVAVSYQIGDYRGSFNGSVDLQDTQGQYLYTPNKLHIGSSPILNSNFNGHITDFAYYKVHNVINLQTATANP